MTLGELLRTRRVKLGMSLDDVAAAVGTTKSTLCRVERWHVEPGIVLCTRLSVLLRVSVQTMAAAALGAYR